MKSFDERAEATSERRDRRDRGTPSSPELRAVREALASRQRQLKDDFDSLDVMLVITDRGPGREGGPPPPGTYSGDIVVKLFRSVATNIRATRDAVSAVNFDHDDKQNFTASLNAAAKSWEARAQMSETLDPTAVEAARQKAEQRDTDAARFGKSLKRYFEGDEEQ
jgi:hypothetical protein